MRVYSENLMYTMANKLTYFSLVATYCISKSGQLFFRYFHIFVLNRCYHIYDLVHDVATVSGLFKQLKHVGILSEI